MSLIFSTLIGLVICTCNKQKEEKMASTSGKLEDCEVCGSQKAKYTCPKCEVRTCSLTCVNIHKKELDCDGIRDKTKYIPLKSFTDLDLLSDYRLLEEIGRVVDNCKRKREKKHMRQYQSLPLHLHRLKSAAYHRKVLLLFMPQHSSRHEANTTYLNWKTNELFWRIEWIFPQAENAKWVVKRVLETTRLSNIIEQILDPVTPLENKVDIAELNLKMTLAERLQFYKAAGLNGIKILLKAEKVKKSGFRFYDLDLTLSLKENLANKTIIEFPTLYVIMKDHSDMYEIIESDDETDNTKYERHMVKKRRNTDKESDSEKKEDNPINYFFNDFSESEDEVNCNKSNEDKKSPNLNIPTSEELVSVNPSSSN